MGSAVKEEASLLEAFRSSAVNHSRCLILGTTDVI